MEEFKQIAKELLAESKFSKAELSGINHLAGDASGRRYIRLELKNAPVSSILLMLLNTQVGPLVAGNNYNSQDDSFVEIANLLESSGLNVPTIYHDRRDIKALLIEDLGNLPLWKLAFSSDAEAEEELIQELGDDFLFKLYEKALFQLKKLQSISDKQHPVFQRYLGFEQYRAEAQRLVTFYLEPNNFKKSEIKEIEEALDNLCESIVSHKNVLMHRDFMPWNLQVKDQDIFVIDFQDCLVGSENYDLVALLHDRDIDFKTGESFVKRVVKAYYAEQLDGNKQKIKSAYHEVLLQRYFRLAGQFDMLSKKTGNPLYKDWVPGCFRRATWGLLNVDYMQNVLDILYKKVPEVAESVADAWKIFD